MEVKRERLQLLAAPFTRRIVLREPEADEWDKLMLDCGHEVLVIRAICWEEPGDVKYCPECVQLLAKTLRRAR
jgi:hypothetical protein